MVNNDLLELFPKITILNEEISEGLIVLFLTACLATGGLVIAGYIIDRKPKFSRYLITGSLVINGFCLYLIVLGIDSIILIVVGLPILGFFLGILASVSGAVYAAYSDIENRGKIYAFALFLATIFAVIIIPSVEILNSDFRTPLFLIGSFSLVCGLFYPFFSKLDRAWHNDPFPTPIRDIINRKPVQAYLLAHFFIYLMLGIAFTTISQEEDARLFWFSVFLGDMCFVLPMGWLSDRLGRKDLIVVGAYGIVISSLIVGLTDNNLLYYFAAFLLGVSFASMHVSIDSAVWSDLSPLDSIGRYYALGFIFLLQGVGVGLLIGIVIPVSDSFEPLDLFLLLVSMSGMLFFDYDFKHKEKISEKDLALVTGALSAISLFFEGVDEQHKALDLVQHGNVFIVQAVVHTKKGDIIATLFANKASTELQNKLDEFITNFCNKFEKEISEWIGQPSVFIKGFEVAEAVFGPLIPAKTIFRDLNAKNVLRKHKD
ncbi:MAG: MFS transporter [Candidatus Hodarchaeales archaeon]